MRGVFVLMLGLLGWPALAVAHEAKHQQHEWRLPTIAAAPALRGKVVALTFIYASCPDVCPMLTDKLARVQDALGSAFGSKIAFVSITTDPERDTPEVLKGYAEAFEANLAGWSFLTGERAAVLDVAHRYGVAVAKAADGQVDHTMLTTLIDRQGTMRVHISAIGSMRRSSAATS